IETVTSGDECIDLINSGKKYDLILLDQMMPEMDGIETLHELKKIKGFNTPVVVLTADAIVGVKEKYLNEGFDDYLSKPIDVKELNQLLKKYLRKEEE
ncbi:MAG: response regulator, partial [Mollicutes bacterium]|nr:response regulator [Mollicutes bacterium]